MKKIGVFFIAVLLSFYCSASPTGSIQRLVNEFDHYEEFEVIKIGRLPMAVLRLLAKSDAGGDKDSAKALSMLNGVKGLTIAEYEDAVPSVRDKFNARLLGLLKGCDLLMEAKSDGDKVFIYGDVTDSTVRNLILFTPEDCALIMVRGTIKLEDLNGFVAR